MKRRHCWMGLLWPGCLGAAPGAPSKVLVPDDVRLDYERFLAGRAVADIHEYHGAHARRDVVELVLLLQALARGGLSESPTLDAVPTVPRLVRELSQGRGVVSGTTYWKADVEDPEAFHFSRPMVQDGEFVVGVYTLPSRADVLASRDRSDLRQWRFVSSRHWRVDWGTLQALGPTQIVHADLWEAMPRMLRAGRADALLAPFQRTPDLSLEVEGVRLVPVPGVKLALHGTRHYLLSKQHPAAAHWGQVLEAGLKQLQEQGVVRRAYQQSGFFSPQVSRWRLL